MARIVSAILPLFASASLAAEWSLHNHIDDAAVFPQ